MLLLTRRGCPRAADHAPRHRGIEGRAPAWTRAAGAPSRCGRTSTCPLAAGTCWSCPPSSPTSPASRSPRSSPGTPAPPSRRSRRTIMLLDATTGAVCALMDGTFLTALRNRRGAGRRDRRAGPPGRARRRPHRHRRSGGRPARGDAVRARPHRGARRGARDPARTAAFRRPGCADELADRFDTRIVVAPSPAHAVDGADIINRRDDLAPPGSSTGRLRRPGGRTSTAWAATPPTCRSSTAGARPGGPRRHRHRGRPRRDRGPDPPIARACSTAAAVVELGAVLTGVAPGRRAHRPAHRCSTRSAPRLLDVVSAHRVYTAALAAGAGHRSSSDPGAPVLDDPAGGRPRKDGRPRDIRICAVGRFVRGSGRGTPPQRAVTPRCSTC